MKPWIKGMVIALGVLGLAGTALGGQQWFMPVDVNLASGYARGSMGDARNSPDAVQYIGCYNSSSAGFTSVACEAQTATGVYKSCATADPNMVASARSIGVASYIFFRWDASGACTNIHVTNYSLMRPAVP